MRAKLPLFVFLLLLFLILAAVTALFHYSQPIRVFRQEAVFGELSLSGMEYTQGRKVLEDRLTRPIYLDLEATSQAETLENIGVFINDEQLLHLTKNCPSDLLRLFCINEFAGEMVAGDALEVDSAKLDSFIKEFEENLAFMVNNTIISFEDYTFRPLSADAKVLIDRNTFMTKAKLAEIVGQDRVSLALTTETVDDSKLQAEITKELSVNMAYPLLIKYGKNPIYIPEYEVGTFITTKIEDGLTVGKIAEQEISDYITELGETYASEDVRVYHQEATEAIQRALLFRASNYQINNAVILPLEGKPRTNGELHDTYLEVIKSQQRLYRFENGKLAKTYIVSTGLTWDTPPGTYEVQGKQAMTISYFGNWYMPWYLPIGTINGYRFGFHAIPYHIDGAGNIYSRDPNTMGSPATGGCIQLVEKEAKELFEWARIGTPVYIYE